MRDRKNFMLDEPGTKLKHIYMDSSFINGRIQIVFNSALKVQHWKSTFLLLFSIKMEGENPLDPREQTHPCVVSKIERTNNICSITTGNTRMRICNASSAI